MFYSESGFAHVPVNFPVEFPLGRLIMGFESKEARTLHTYCIECKHFPGFRLVLFGAVRAWSDGN